MTLWIYRDSDLLAWATAWQLSSKYLKYVAVNLWGKVHKFRELFSSFFSVVLLHAECGSWLEMKTAVDWAHLLVEIILGVAIALAIAILIFLLIVLYCCESYRNHRKFAKLLRMLGAPQAQDDNFDDFEDYGKSDAWREETDASKCFLQYRNRNTNWIMGNIIM